MNSIGCEALQEKLERGDELVLLDARSPMAYAMSHLPGALNLPLVRVDERARRVIPDGDTEVVVYCESAECTSSTQVAARLRELGYSNVTHYSEGQRGWVEAGYALEGGQT